MRLLVGDRGGVVDAATPRVRTPKKGASQRTSGTRDMRSRESKSRDNWSREFPLQAADAGREGLQNRKQGGAKAMIRSISDRVARDSVGPNATIPTSPASSTSSASSASSPKAIQGNASSRGRHPSRVAASDPLERTLPRKFRLNDDDTATTVRSEATDGEEDSDAGSVSMRQLRREIDDLRTQLEQCVRINKLLSESLRSAERTANEATAAARVLASERDDVVKELEEVLKAWSQADDVAVAKQKEERATAQRTRVSLEWARAVLAQEREAVGREREELKQEREALQKDKERITKDAAKRAAQEVQGERSKLQQQAGMMGMQQQQHHVTPEGVLVRSVSMNSTCNCLNSTQSSADTRSNNEAATDQQASKQGGSRSSGNIKVGASASRMIPSCRSESDLSACASRAQEHAPTGLPHSASVVEYGPSSPKKVTSPKERVGRTAVAPPQTSALSPPSRSPRSTSTAGYSSSSSLGSVGSYSSVLDYGAKPPMFPGLLQDPRMSGRRMKFSLIE
ncbi:unnamed protein product [Closterium sp. NIES-54]